MEKKLIEIIMNLPSFFIQARSNSSRLKGKMLLPFWNNKSILQIIIERLINAFGTERIFLLTTESPTDDELVNRVSQYKIGIFRGSEEDVLNRFIKAGEIFEKEEIIRICADNPFLDIESLKIIVEDSGEADYISFSYKDIPVIKTHLGFFAERTKLRILKKVYSLTDESLYREHVTNYIYAHPDMFKCKFFPVESKFDFFDKLRLTVDTEADFNTAKEIFAQLPDPMNFTLNEVISIINQNPQMISLMEEQIKLNTK